ncbi:palmitoyltransferase for Vac8p [Serendipita sp. 401]|nr:palmitoyltransferase for Vac8p [Serendipita sp. 401]
MWFAPTRKIQTERKLINVIIIMIRCPPILSRPSYFSLLRNSQNHNEDEYGYNPPPRPWTAFILPSFAVFLLLLPQPSWLILLSSQYFTDIMGLVHGVISTTITLLAINSLAICVFRDPGRPNPNDVETPTTAAKSSFTFNGEGGEEGEEERDALMEGQTEEERHEDVDEPNDFNSSRKWCRTCWAPKPERTHHCSTCGRCVLRMDHHCPWVAQCVGHRTHMAFLHLLACVTLLSTYITVISSSTLYTILFSTLAQPIDDATPLHCLLLVVMGFVFALVIGSFFGFHLYLCATNQTTLEQLSPYALLKYLPRSNVARHAPGTSITHGVDATTSVDTAQRTKTGVFETVPPPRNRPGTQNQNADATDEDSPYYFPSPPPTPPKQVPKSLADIPKVLGEGVRETLGEIKESLLAHNPLSTIPGSEPGTPPDGMVRAADLDQVKRPDSKRGGKLNSKQYPGVTRTVVFSSSPVATTSTPNVYLNPALPHGWGDTGSSQPTGSYTSTGGTRKAGNSDGGYYEWDEHSLTRAQSRLVRHTAGRLRLWDVGFRRNLISVLGSGQDPGLPRSRMRSGDGEEQERSRRERSRGASVYSRSRRSKAPREIKPYSPFWWITVLLYGGPPRGDGKTFARNPKARGMLIDLRNKLEEIEKRERSGYEDAPEDEEEHRVASARMTGRNDSRYAIADEMELEEV